MTESAGIPDVLAIGWDVGGWEGKAQGLAAFRIQDGKVTLIPPRADRLPRSGLPTLAAFIAWALDEPARQVASERIVLAVDAPFGFPRAFRNLVNGTAASIWSLGRQVANPYALRWTDRLIHSKFKTPLSAAFDKLGNNTTVAMHHLAVWRRESGLRVLPFDAADGSAPVAIEVYPAFLRASRDGARPDWLKALAPDWAERNGDAADAVVCAALALAWAAGGRGSLPALEPPPVGCPDDGWIFYPSGSEWSREGRDHELLEPRT